MTNPRTHLEKILKSSAFNKSDIHKKLLTFLVKCYQANKTPNELEIARTIFGRTADFNPAEDTIVRVSFYKLRKKIDDYYNKEGKNDEYRLSIPRGQYNIQFDKKTIPIQLEVKKYRWGVAMLMAVCVVLLLVVVSQQLELKNQKGAIHQSEPNFHSEIWSTYFNNSLQYDVIIGDYYIFEEYSTKLDKRRRIMDYGINTEKEFYAYKQKFPSLEFNVLSIGELPHHTLYTLQDITHLFDLYHQKFMLKTSRDYLLKETLGHNILYQGDFKCLRELDGFLESHHIQFEYKGPFNGILYILDAAKDTVQIFDNSKIDLTKESKSLDYCLIFKTVGPNDENYLFVTGSGYIAQLEAVDILCNQDRVTVFENQIKKLNGEIPESFLVVLETTGVYLTPYHSEIVYFKSLDK